MEATPTLGTKSQAVLASATSILILENDFFFYPSLVSPTT